MNSSSTSLGSLYSFSKYSFHLFRTSTGSVRTLPSSTPGACVCVILLIPSYTALGLLLALLFSTSLHIPLMNFSLSSLTLFLTIQHKQSCCFAMSALSLLLLLYSLLSSISLSVLSDIHYTLSLLFLYPSVFTDASWNMSFTLIHSSSIPSTFSVINSSHLWSILV